MTEERRQILDMLAEGKISAEDAERLLEKLGDNPANDKPAPSETNPRKLKFLRVLVESTEGDKVNVRVPLALIKTGIKLTAVLPDNVSEKLGDEGIDLSNLTELDGDELYDALRDLKVDVDSEEGDIVRVFCE